MEKEDIKKMYEWIQSRVELAADPGAIAILFDEPSVVDFKNKGFDDEAVALTLESTWWPEMATDIIETPDYAEPGESPEQVLQYARDVVVEYVRKRLGT